MNRTNGERRSLLGRVTTGYERETVWLQIVAEAYRYLEQLSSQLALTERLADTRPGCR
jgi:hypothetical protein